MGKSYGIWSAARPAGHFPVSEVYNFPNTAVARKSYRFQAGTAKEAAKSRVFEGLTEQAPLIYGDFPRISILKVLSGIDRIGVFY